MTREGLWPYALEIYGRPGAQPLLLALQDGHDQCVPYLLWALWMAAAERPADDATLAAGAALARAWGEAAIRPLRELRRDLKRPAQPPVMAARERLRGGVQALEIDAERMLLQMLEDASLPVGDEAGAPDEALRRAVEAWDAPAPTELLRRLAALAA